MPRTLIVEADGGSRGNPGPAAFGTVVRDAATGTVLAEIAEYLGEASNNVAEYRGAIAGLAFAYGLDPEANVEMRLDSKLIVEQMSGRWQIKSPNMRTLARQARDIYPPGQVSYTWVPRAQNARADALVNEMIDAALARGEVVIRRVDGLPSEDASADDVVGSIDVERSRVVVEQQIARRPPVTMIGWADLGRPTVTVLARHGATALSLEKRFSGRDGLDPALAPIGLRQAEALAEEIQRRDAVTRIVSSPLLRTRETAGIVADRLGLPVEIDDGFAECAFGEWDGRTFLEVKEQWPTELVVRRLSRPSRGGPSPDCRVLPWGTRPHRRARHADQDPGEHGGRRAAHQPVPHGAAALLAVDAGLVPGRQCIDVQLRGGCAPAFGSGAGRNLAGHDVQPPRPGLLDPVAGLREGRDHVPGAARRAAKAEQLAGKTPLRRLVVVAHGDASAVALLHDADRHPVVDAWGRGQVEVSPGPQVHDRTLHVTEHRPEGYSPGGAHCPDVWECRATAQPVGRDEVGWSDETPPRLRR
jgi:ribonuclease HI